MMNESQIELLGQVLRNEQVEVTFTKKNGEERIMNCTKSIPLMQKVNPEFTLSTSDKPKKKNEDVIVVYDTDKLGYRSFRKDSVISFQTKLFKVLS